MPSFMSEEKKTPQKSFLMAGHDKQQMSDADLHIPLKNIASPPR